ncbi:resistance to lethality of mkk1p386 overexpression [Taxawa tesnikishii (nom. ined.)]|nr:resistance to lethality of mkk1p386 overexpression [Dothideales sp. JES 119]
MGRRKIEIRPIKDDRNRSVTFLKRKGGLFKKAYELGVLCSVDVAVIIFGHNKKLYEFSSGDIHETIGRFQYYGGAHEHKGPADFAGKGGGDDEDEEEDNPQGISRPSSRASHQHLRRTSSNLAIPQHHPASQAPTPQPSYAYTPNPPFYNPQAAAGVQQVQRGTPPQPHPQAPQYHYTHPQPTHQQMQQAYMQDQRRSSMPPAYPHPIPQPPQAAPQTRQPTPQPPPQEQQQRLSVSQPQPRPSPQPDQSTFQSPPLPQPKPLPAHAKSYSIFTPIDDSRSLLAQHWGGTSTSEPQPTIKVEGPRSQSIDVAAMSRDKANGASPKPPPAPLPARPPQRTASSSSVPSIPLPSRASTMQSEAKRPRLKVQIPSEQSDGGSATGDSSPKDTTTTAGTGIGTGPAPAANPGVVLPPPSPSTNALLSAGASGPPNPFARPAPPISTNPHAVNRERDHIETPLSALPSRIMEGNQMLPSPSSLWADAWWDRNSNNMMPSPLNFQTPVAFSGPSFRDEDADRKRKLDEEDAGGGGKRTRS